MSDNTNLRSYVHYTLEIFPRLANQIHWYNHVLLEFVIYVMACLQGFWVPIYCGLWLVVPKIHGLKIKRWVEWVAFFCGFLCISAEYPDFIAARNRWWLSMPQNTSQVSDSNCKIIIYPDESVGLHVMPRRMFGLMCTIIQKCFNRYIQTWHTHVFGSEQETYFWGWPKLPIMKKLWPP